MAASPGRAGLVVVLAALAAPWPPGLVAQGPAGAVPEVQLPVRELALENGMRFLVLPNPSSPSVAFVMRYDVGGVNEVLGTTGIAHLLEHLLFKGTRTIGTREPDRERQLLDRMDRVQDSLFQEAGRPNGGDGRRVEELRSRLRAMEDVARSLVVPNEFDRILTRNGARSLNATTSSEATTYFVELPANRARLWFVLEADRFRNPVFREFYTERDVVAEERRMRVDTSPGGLLYEAHMAAAFQMHPYGVPVVGYMSDIRHLPRTRVEEYYRQYYGPNNAVVAVVGDVDPDSVARWAVDYFGDVPPGDPPPPVLAVEPQQRGERRIEVVFDAEPMIRIGWHTVSDYHPDRPALAMLAAVLTGGRTSRLYRRMVVEERIATFVAATTEPGSRYPQLFVVQASPRSPHGTEALEAVVYEELEQISRQAPSERELEGVRNQLEASRVRRLQSNLGLALQLADAEALHGDWRAMFALNEAMRAVTPEDIRRVAARYFPRENRTVAVLVKPEASVEPTR